MSSVTVEKLSSDLVVIRDEYRLAISNIESRRAEYATEKAYQHQLARYKLALARFTEEVR